MNLFRNTCILILFIFANNLYSKNKELYNNLSKDSILVKTIRVKYTEFGKDLFCGGHTEDGRILKELMGEVPYSALGFSYKDEDYYISITKYASKDFLFNLQADRDSLVITIKMFPYYHKERDVKVPFSFVTNIEKLQNDSTSSTSMPVSTPPSPPSSILPTPSRGMPLGTIPICIALQIPSIVSIPTE